MLDLNFEIQRLIHLIGIQALVFFFFFFFFFFFLNFLFPNPSITFHLESLLKWGISRSHLTTC